MSIDRWLDTEAVIHTHDGILLSHKKEGIWVSSDEVDEPRAYHTEWSASEIERWILYSNTYIPNLKKWWRTYFQGSNGETDIESRLWTGERGGEGEMHGGSNMETYITGSCCMAQETQTGALYQSRGVGRGLKWDGGSKGRGYMYTYGWFTLRFERKQQNYVKQLSFNKKKI